MGSGGGSVGIAGTTEHAKVVVRGGYVEQGKKRGGMGDRLEGKMV